MPFGELSRGISDLAVYVLGANDVLGTKVDVPGARAFEWSAESTADTIEGDDEILGTAYSAKEGSGSLSTAKANLTALAAMLGTTAVASGTTPNQLVTMEESSAANQVNLAFKAQAKSVDQAGSAFQVQIWKAKVGSVSESLENGAWHIPSIDFTFVNNVNSKFITRVLQETLVPLA